MDNCINGDYAIEIKDGKVSGTAEFFDRRIANSQRRSTVGGQVRPDNTASVILVRQVPDGRSSRYEGKFENNEFKAVDQPSTGGRCIYDVVWKKKG